MFRQFVENYRDDGVESDIPNCRAQRRPCPFNVHFLHGVQRSTYDRQEYLQRKRVAERPLAMTLPEVCEDNYACDRCVGTPQRSERVPLERHYSQENRQICGPEDYHRPDLRKKQGTARRNDV